MKKTILSLIVFLTFAVPCLVVVTPGCTSTTQTRTYQTLYTVGHTTDAAYSSYLDLVVAKQIKTNGVPKVSQGYREFQLAFSFALATAQFNTNSPAPPEVLSKSTSVINLIQQNK